MKRFAWNLIEETNYIIAKYDRTLKIVFPTGSVPITVAARSKAWTVIARSNTGIVGLNPTSGMDVWCVCVCVCVYTFFCVCIVLYLGTGLATGRPLVQGVLQIV
jgi:hypothetical protein